MASRIWPRTVRGLGLAIALIAAIMSLLLAAAMILTMHHELERQLDQRIEIETQSLIGLYRDHDFGELARVVALRDGNRAPGGIGYLAGVDDAGRATGYILVDRDGRRRAGSLDAALPPEGWSEFLKFRRADGSTGVAQALNTRLADGSQLVVTADRAILKTMRWKIFQLFAIGFGSMLALGLLATLGFGRVVRARLAAIETSAGAIMAGDLAARMPVDGSGSEFDRLSTVLNRMLDRIGDLLGNLRQVSGDIAHDLRTPLQRIRGKLERMADRAEGSAFETPLAESLRDTDDLLELFEALLAISEIEGQSVRARFAVFDLHEAVGEMAELYRPTIEEAGRTLTFEGEPASVPGDRKLVQQAVANLLDNALIHAVPSSRIDIAVEIAGENAVLTISDDGPGIASADHERIFQRLVRLDASRATPGHGLGLSLVSAIAAAHRGSVTASTGARGLGVRLILQVAKAGA